MYKQILKQSLYSTYKLATAIAILFAAMVALKFLNGGTEAVHEYFQSVDAIRLLTTGFAFFVSIFAITFALAFINSKPQKKERQ